MLLNTLFVKQTQNTFILMLRYALVSWIAFVIDAGMLFVFTHYLDIYYLVSTVFSSLCGGIANYLLSISPQVFGKSNMNNKFVDFLLFTLIGAGGLLINVTIMWLFTDQFGWYYMISKIVAIVAVFLFTFFVRRWMFIRNSEPKQQNAVDLSD